MTERDTFLELQMYAQDTAKKRESGRTQSATELTATFNRADAMFMEWTAWQLMSLMDTAFSLLIASVAGVDCETDTAARDRCTHWLYARMQSHMALMEVLTAEKS